MDIDKALADYTKVDETPFCVLFDMTHSDKGNRWHQYSRFYYTLMRPLRDIPFHLFELGIGSNNPSIPSNMGLGGRPGASLFVWQMYFKHAKIYAADIDRNILDNRNERIRCFYCDQTDPASVKNLWQESELANKEFMIIIDDGLHLPDANLNFFEHSIHKLQKGGVYVIEDIHPDYSETFVKLIEDCKVRYPHLTCRFVHIQTATNEKPIQNYMFIAQYKN